MTTCTNLRPQRADARRGQTTVEFSLILLPFFILVFATLDIAMYYFYDGSLENAMRETAHFTSVGGIIPQTSGGTNLLTNYQGFPVPRAIWDPYTGAPNEASRNECSKLDFRSNTLLPGISWETNVHLSSQTNVPPKMPLLAADGRTLYPAILGPGNMTDYCQVVGTVPVASITGFMSYLSSYQEQGGQYVMRAATTTVNEPNPSTFLPYNSTNSEEIQ